MPKLLCLGYQNTNKVEAFIKENRKAIEEVLSFNDLYL